VQEGVTQPRRSNLEGCRRPTLNQPAPQPPARRGRGSDGRPARPGAGEEDPGAVHWIFKNKDHGKTAAAASLGLIALWDVEGGLPQIDKFLYSKDPHVVAGARPALPAARAPPCPTAVPRWRSGRAALPLHKPACQDARRRHAGLRERCFAPSSAGDFDMARMQTAAPAAWPALRRIPVQARAGLAAPHARRASRRVRAGALLAVGVLNCGVQHENDPAYALLYDFVEKPDATIRIGAIMGLGLAYAGARAGRPHRPPRLAACARPAGLVCSAAVRPRGARRALLSSMVPIPGRGCNRGRLQDTHPGCFITLLHRSSPSLMGHRDASVRLPRCSKRPGPPARPAHRQGRGAARARAGWRSPGLR
jgi:hypothetical protein